MRYTDPDGRETLNKYVNQIKLDLTTKDVEKLAVAFQNKFEQGGALQQVLSSFGIMGNFSSGSQYVLEAIGKELDNYGSMFFKTIDKVCFFVGIMELVAPDNVEKPRNEVFSFWAKLITVEDDSNFEILNITSTITSTEEETIVNHHDNIICVTNKTKVQLEAKVYDKYNNKIITFNNEYTLESSYLEF